MKKRPPKEEIICDPCGCMVKREDGVIVQAKSCKMHRESMVKDHSKFCLSETH
jgi:hypothetical protein